MTKRNSIETEIAAIRKRYAELTANERIEFVNHLRSLARWHNEPMDYPERTNICFPNEIHVAYAVCHPECGTEEFIVDGSTQECHYCGSPMFRSEVAKYKLENSTIRRKKEEKKAKGHPNQAL